MTEEPPPDATPLRQERFAQRTSPLAVWCFVFGLLSFLLPVVFSVRAIVMGLLAVQELKRKQDSRSGYFWTYGGMACGWLTLFCGGIGAIFLLTVEGERIKSGGLLTITMNQSRNIFVALQVHEAYRGKLPVVVPTNVAAPGLSWRVHILPYLRQADLYAQFKLDEPWDSPHNKLLIPKMPKDYQRVHSYFKRESGKTCFQLVTGPGSLFDPANGPASPSLATPHQRTALLVITDDARAVTWTAPQDYDRSLAPVGIWTSRGGDTMVSYSDGQVHMLDVKSPADLLDHVEN